MIRILVVDDDIQLRPLLVQMLTRAGYEVLSAENGEEALHILKHESIDLMITDIIMPDKEGLETITEIRQTNQDIKIIAISGGGRGDAYTYLRMAKEQGANHTLNKPFERNEMLEAIKELLGVDEPSACETAP